MDRTPWAIPVNVLLDTIGWFACGLGAAYGLGSSSRSSRPLWYRSQATWACRYVGS